MENNLTIILQYFHYGSFCPHIHLAKACACDDTTSSKKKWEGEKEASMMAANRKRESQ